MTGACAGLQDELESLGTAEPTPALEAAAVKARKMLAEWLKVDTSAQGVQSQIIGELAKRSEDVDVDVPWWLSGNTPLGIELPIVPRGVFPLAENIVGAEVGLDPWAPSRGNYASYHEHQVAADAVFQEELERGRLEWSPSVGELTKKYGPIARSRIAVIAKQKGGHLKVRLVHDLRRSGVNE